MTLTTFLKCFNKGERWKYARKEVRLNQVWNAQPPGHEFDMLTTEPPWWGTRVLEFNAVSLYGKKVFRIVLHQYFQCFDYILYLTIWYQSMSKHESSHYRFPWHQACFLLQLLHHFFPSSCYSLMIGEKIVNLQPVKTTFLTLQVYGLSVQILAECFDFVMMK